MKILRTVLFVLLFLAVAVFVVIMPRWWTPDPWNFPKDSLRFIGYNYLVVKHGGFLAAASIVYFILVAVAYKKECLELLESEGGVGSWKVLLFILIAVFFLMGWSAQFFH